MKRCKCKHQQQGMSRRQALSMLSLAGVFLPIQDPIRMITGSSVDGLIASAQAQGGILPRNYICILHPGAPTGWVFHNFLRPRGDLDQFVPNLSVGNKLTENAYTGDSSKITHTTTQIFLGGGQSIHLPPIWGSNIPVTGGGTIPMSALLTNTLIVRGCHMQVDRGHVRGPALVPRPIMTGPSLTGLVADASLTPIPAVSTVNEGYGTPQGNPKIGTYKSPKGTGIVLVKGISNSTLNDILGPFQITDANVVAGKTKLQSAQIEIAVNDAMAELAAYASSGKPGSDVLFQMRSKAENLFKQAFGDLTGQLTTLIAKYSNLESIVSHMEVPNIIPPGVGPDNYNLASGTYGFGYAKHFAVAEFLIKQGLSQSITFAPSGSSKIANITASNDEHDESNRQRSLICQTARFRALAAMIHEFKTSLGADLWSETVISIGAEYDRSPRNDPTNLGSDHAPSSNAITVMSGAIQTPTFIGNIKANVTYGTVTGTWGSAAPVETNFGNLIINNEYMASTIAKLLRVESPTPNRPSLIDISGNTIVSNTEGPKNV